MSEGQSAPDATPSLTLWVRSLAVVFFVGLSVALAVWGSTHQDELGAYMTHNRLAPDQRSALLSLLGIGGLGFLGAGLALGLRAGVESLERAATRMAPLFVCGLLPFLLSYRHWEGRDLTFLSLTLACALGAGTMMRRALSAGLYPSWAWPSNLLKRPRHLSLIIVSVAAAAYGIYFSVSTINNHHNFGTSSFDLGIETNLMWNTAHGGPLFRSAPYGGTMLHGGRHQTYFAFLLVPFYLLFQKAETLLVIQSVFLGAAAIPLFLLARKKLGESKAAILSCLYLLYAPNHGANLYDFHYQPFGVFFLFLLAHLFEEGKGWKVLAPLVLVTLSIREDVGAMVGALGGYMLLIGKRPRDALILASVGSAYFVAQKLYIMPELFMNGKSSFVFMFKQLVPAGDDGFGGVLKTAGGNPVFTADTILTKEKLTYVLQLFVPLALLPLRRSLALVLYLPAFVFTLLSTQYPALIMTTFQYTAYWTPMVFIAAIAALSALSESHRPRGLATAWMVSLCLGIVITSARYGAVFQVETARGAFDPVHLRKTEEGQKNRADFLALAQKVPPDAKIAASEWLISHVADRRDAYSLRNGVLDAEYILFWLHPTKFRADERPVLKEALFSNRRYSVIDRRGMFVLAKKGHKLKKPHPRELRREIAWAGTPRATAPRPEPKRPSQ